MSVYLQLTDSIKLPCYSLRILVDLGAEIKFLFFYAFRPRGGALPLIVHFLISIKDLLNILGVSWYLLFLLNCAQLPRKNQFEGLLHLLLRYG